MAMNYVTGCAVLAWNLGLCTSLAGATIRIELKCSVAVLLRTVDQQLVTTCCCNLKTLLSSDSKHHPVSPGGLVDSHTNHGSTERTVPRLKSIQGGVRPSATRSKGEHLAPWASTERSSMDFPSMNATFDDQALLGGCFVTGSLRRHMLGPQWSRRQRQATSSPLRHKRLRHF